MTASPRYALGHSARELKRLSTQARVFEPFTRRMLQDAGVAAGMRILDVGSGTGDVAFLCAALAGSTGEVVGLDKAAAAVDTANLRAVEAGLKNVSFLQADAAEVTFDQPFDAIVGRLVLMHQAQPSALLRRLARYLRPDGIVAFQEFDLAAARSCPPSRTYDQCLRWMAAAFTATGTNVGMGPQLYSTFVDAGLPEPAMSLDAGIWGGEGPAATLVTEVMRSLLPVLPKFGIATEAEVEIDSLEDRLRMEITSTRGVAISPSLIGARTRVP